MSLPLHVKTVKRFDMEKVRALLQPMEHIYERFEHAWQQLTDPETLMRQAQNQKANHKFPREGEMTAADIDLLLQKDLISEIPVEDVMACARTFTCVEREKGRRRWILAPSLNETSDEVGEVPLPTTVELERGLADPEALTLDFPWFYGQMELPVPARRFYAFHVQGRWYVPHTMPTGGRHVPELAQSISQGIALAANDGDDHRAAATAVYLDNIRQTGKHDELLRFRRSILHVVDSLNGTLVEDEFTQGTSYTFLGIDYDHTKKTVSLGAKTKRKLEEIIQLARLRQKATIRDWLRVFGLTMWSSTATHCPGAAFWPAFKFTRRLDAQPNHLDKPINVWPCAWKAMLRWIHDIIERKWQWHPQAQDPILLFTDATPQGFGFVRTRGSTILDIGGGVFEKQEHINILEMRAVLYALQRTPRGSPTSEYTLSIYVDNTSVLYQARRGYARSFTANALLLRLNECVTTRQIRIESINYISTHENPADPLSRAYLTKMKVKILREVFFSNM